MKVSLQAHYQHRATLPVYKLSSPIPSALEVKPFRLEFKDTSLYVMQWNTGAETHITLRSIQATHHLVAGTKCFERLELYIPPKTAGAFIPVVFDKLTGVL